LKGYSHELTRIQEICMAERKTRRDSDKRVLSEAVREGERIQAATDEKDRTKPKKKVSGPVQAGCVCVYGCADVRSISRVPKLEWYF
jgi:hypothetical protein